MNTKMFFALVGCLFTSSAFATPLSLHSVTRSLDAQGIERIAIVCDAWGQCFETAPNYYGNPYDDRHAWRHWKRDQEHALRHWEHEREHAWKHHWSDWDGHDWHGGRWGDW